MLHLTALRAIGLTAALAFGTLSASAQAVKPGKGIPGGGNPGVAAGAGGGAGGAMQPGGGRMGGGGRGHLGGMSPRGGGGGQMAAGRPGGWNGQRGGGWHGRPDGDHRRWNGHRGGGWRGPAIGAGIGLGLGLATGGYPYYGYYDTPAYGPAYAPAALGDHCDTPRKVCTLYDSAPIGVDCSCRVPGGRAHGEVVP